MSDFVYYSEQGETVRYPKAYVVASQRSRDDDRFRLVTVECPLCPKRHVHGDLRGIRGDLGHRSPHCESKYRDKFPEDAPHGYVVWDETPLNPWEK